MMNAKTFATRGAAALLAVLLFGGLLTARAQEGRLRIDNLDRLAPRATESVEVTLNDVQMDFLRKLVSLSASDQARLKGLMAKLKGVYVRGFEFAQDGEYSDADIEAIRAQLRAPGWERIVEVRNRNSGGDEVFFLPRNGQVVGYAAISTGPKNICVINVVGPIDVDEMGLLEKEFNLSRCGKSNPERRRKDTR
jgi:hypothetical protein